MIVLELLIALIMDNAYPEIHRIAIVMKDGLELIVQSVRNQRTQNYNNFNSQHIVLMIAVAQEFAIRF